MGKVNGGTQKLQLRISKDSFFLTIATDTKYFLSDVFNNLAQHIDTSNYPPFHPLYSVVNKAKLGCFKDETGGRELEISRAT